MIMLINILTFFVMTVISSSPKKMEPISYPSDICGTQQATISSAQFYDCNNPITAQQCFETCVATDSCVAFQVTKMTQRAWAGHGNCADSGEQGYICTPQSACRVDSNHRWDFYRVIDATNVPSNMPTPYPSDLPATGVVSAGSCNLHCAGFGSPRIFSNGDFPTNWIYNTNLLNPATIMNNVITYDAAIQDGVCVVEVLAGYYETLDFNTASMRHNSFAVSSDGENWRTPAGFDNTLNRQYSDLSGSVALEADVTHFAFTSGAGEQICHTFVLTPKANDVDGACLIDGSPHSLAFIPDVLNADPDEALGEIQCCNPSHGCSRRSPWNSGSNNDCISGNDDQKKYTFQEANDMCADLGSGWTLCTREQIYTSICRSKGCQHDRALVWALCVETSSPTSDPTKNPTSNPTHTPTRNPTNTPTYDPSSFPSLNPTLNPSTDPTTNPTNMPSANPSKTPTSNPSNRPTATPTSTPSLTPTANPSSSPTIGPTSCPTLTPSENPSSNPTRTPTMFPTSSPSLTPTATPSMAPTLSPSPMPTAKEFMMKIKGFHGSPGSSLARIVFAQDRAEVEKIDFDVQAIKTAQD